MVEGHEGFDVGDKMVKVLQKSYGWFINSASHAGGNDNMIFIFYFLF